MNISITDDKNNEKILIEKFNKLNNNSTCLVIDIYNNYHRDVKPLKLIRIEDLKKMGAHEGLRIYKCSTNGNKNTDYFYEYHHKKGIYSPKYPIDYLHLMKNSIEKDGLVSKTVSGGMILRGYSKEYSCPQKIIDTLSGKEVIEEENKNHIIHKDVTKPSDQESIEEESKNYIMPKEVIKELEKKVSKTEIREKFGVCSVSPTSAKVCFANKLKKKIESIINNTDDKYFLIKNGTKCCEYKILRNDAKEDSITLKHRSSKNFIIF